MGLEERAEVAGAGLTARARRVYVCGAEPCRQQQRSGGVRVSASTVKQHVLHRRLNAQRRFVEARSWKPGLSGPESFLVCSGLGVWWLPI